MCKAIVDEVELPIELPRQFADVRLHEGGVVQPGGARRTVCAHYHSDREVDPYDLSVRHVSCHTAQLTAGAATGIEDPCVGCQQWPEYDECFLKDRRREWPYIRVIGFRQAVEFHNKVVMLGVASEQNWVFLFEGEAWAEPRPRRGEPCFAKQIGWLPVPADPGPGRLQDGGGIPPHRPDKQGAGRFV